MPLRTIFRIQYGCLMLGEYGRIYTGLFQIYENICRDKYI